MSDIQRDREERQRVIEILQKEKKTALHDNKWAFDYAIASIKTDLKYDLLYEETSGQADKSTTKNNLGVDAVSRKAFIDWLNSWTLGDASPLIDFVNSMPSVTPQEPKTGHWISHREHCENLGVIPSGLGAYKWCSNCDCGIDVREWHTNNYNFCPNCGAKMQEVEV